MDSVEDYLVVGLADQDDGNRQVADFGAEDPVVLALFVETGFEFIGFGLPDGEDAGVGGAGGFDAHGDECGEVGGGGAVGVVCGGGEKEEVALGSDALVVAVDGKEAVAQGVEAGLDGLAAAIGPFGGKIYHGHQGTLGDGVEGGVLFAGGCAFGGFCTEPDLEGRFSGGGKRAVAVLSEQSGDGGGQISGGGAHFLKTILRTADGDLGVSSCSGEG